jgi:hypothetical protein
MGDLSYANGEYSCAHSLDCLCVHPHEMSYMK